MSESTMTALSVVFPVAYFGTMLAGGSDIVQGNAAKAAADANAEALQNNVTMEQRAAGQREEAMRRNMRLFAGAQRAAIAESGGGFSGTAADVMAQSGTAAELDALIARYDSETRTVALDNEATITRWQGKRARTSGYLDAAGTMLGGVASYGVGSGGAGK